MKISLGPLHFFWPKEQVFDFYRSMAKTSVDTFYLGETVCSKRRLMRLNDWLTIAHSLCAAGKNVVLSTMALVTAESELLSIKKMIAHKEFLIEANDIAVIQMLSGDREFVIGPHINVYNTDTLKFLSSIGAKRWIPPVELSGDILENIKNKQNWPLEMELFAFGQLPLAFSARCFTARAANTAKDNCELRCLDHPQGIPIKTRDGKYFLNINGVQIQSFDYYSLLKYIDKLRKLDIQYLRISPQPQHSEKIIQFFQQQLDGQQDFDDQQLENLVSKPICNGYWSGHAGIYSK